MKIFENCPEAIEWFNRRHATVDLNGQFRIVHLGSATVYKREDFTNIHLDKFVEVQQRNSKDGPSHRPAVDAWLQSELRKHYPGGLTFDPIGFEQRPQKNNSALNLWTGFACKPAPGDAQPFVDFTRDIICSGNPALFEFVMDWIAHLFECPMGKPGTALVLHGEQGTGKSFFADTIGMILGKHYAPISDTEHLVGRFSGHLIDKLLVFGDEGAYATKKAANKLKHLITSPQILVEEKYQKPMVVNSYVRVIIAGNDAQLIHADHDERRYCALEVSSGRRGDREYWKVLHDWRGHCLANLFHWLLTRELGPDGVRHIPKTRGLTEQKLENLSPLDKWIFDGLTDGELCANPWEGWHFSEALLENLIQRGAVRGERVTSVQLGKRLHALFPGIKRQRGRVMSGDGGPPIARPRGYVLPPLKASREGFEKWLGAKLEWPDDEG